MGKKGMGKKGIGVSKAVSLAFGVRDRMGGYDPSDANLKGAAKMAASKVAPSFKKGGADNPYTEVETTPHPKNYYNKS